MTYFQALMWIGHPTERDSVFGRLSEQADAEPLKIQIYDLRTRQLSTIPESEGRFSPRWSPHGQYLAAAASDSIGGRWSLWIGVTLDGSGLFVRDASSQEIYALDTDLP